jgi:hypothetical protein
MNSAIDADESVWRYVSIAKYADLLRTRTLFLPKASLLSDNSEGKWVGHGVIMADRARWKELTDAAQLLEEIVERSNSDNDALDLAQGYALAHQGRLPQVALEVLGNVPCVYPSMRIEYLKSTSQAWHQNAQRSLKGEDDWRQQARTQREAVYISCWNRQSTLSFAMWELYGGGDEAVALKVKAGTLMRSISANASMLSESGYKAHLWPVRYVDVHQEQQALADEMMELLTNTVDITVGQFTIKPPIYADEREVRLIAYPERILIAPVIDPHPEWSGLAMPLKTTAAADARVDKFVEAVHLHPNVDKDAMVFKVIVDLHLAYGLDIPVLVSPMATVI